MSDRTFILAVLHLGGHEGSRLHVELKRWLLSAAFLIAAPAQAASPHSDVELRGRVLAERNCAMCHAIGRAGASPNSAAPPFRDLGRRYPVDDLAEALAQGIITGHPAMPEFRFSPAEVNDLIHYLRTIQTHEAAFAQVPVIR